MIYLLMLMAMKRSDDLKIRGCANGSYQKVHTDKSECSYPVLDFFSLKYARGIITKEGRDAAAVGLPGFFLQTKRDDEEKIMLEITGTVALLITESDPKKWKKHLRQVIKEK